MARSDDGALLITNAEHARVRAHYRRAAPLLLKHFGGTPVIAVTFPNGFEHPPAYHQSFDVQPSTIITVDARTSSGTHRFVALNEHNLVWLCAAQFVVEVDGWGCDLDDPERAAFGRIVLSPQGAVGEDQVFAGAHVLAERLRAEGLEAIPVLDGLRGLSLWIPFSDGPDYDRMAAWLRAFAHSTAEAKPESFTVANLRAERGDRIYLGTKSNHPGMGTLLPYALRGTPQLEVAVPVPFDHLGKVRNGEITEREFAEYVRLFGDAFATERARIGRQTFGDRARAGARTIFALACDDAPRNYIIAAALQILADGKAHDADEILTEGRRRGLLPESTTRKYVYTALHEYVVRTIGAGKLPVLVQVDGTAQFRLNEPEDPWPDFAVPEPPKWLPEARVRALCERLRTTANGPDPAAFEVACCTAFDALGFVATHHGGNGEPDGVLVAPLGTAGYTTILECKTASVGGIVANPRPEEAAKFRAAAGATRSVLIGPAFGGDASFDDELRVHGVALWTIEDLITALEAEIGPDEIRPALEAGRAEGVVRRLLWERAHGRRKRVSLFMDRMWRAGWYAQTTLAGGVGPADAPALTADALFLLGDEALAAEGVHVGPTRDEAEDALAALLVLGAVRADGAGYVTSCPPRFPSGVSDAQTSGSAQVTL